MKRIVLLFCLSLMAVRVAVSQVVTEYDGLYYRFTDGEAAVVSSQGNSYSGDIVIPEEIQLGDKVYRVTQIEKNAFYGNGLTSVDIPATVLKIGENAFYGCSKLKTVILRGYAEIGSGAFLSDYGGVMLDKVACYSSVPPKCGTDCFRCFYELWNTEKREVTLEVPKGFADVYASSIYWYEFSVSEIDAEATEPTVEIDETETGLVQYDGVWYKVTKGAGLSEAVAISKHERGDPGPSYINRSELEIPEKLVLSDRLELTVTEINDQAFSNDSGHNECRFQTLILPGSIRHIGNWALYGSPLDENYLKTIYCYAATPPACTRSSFPYYSREPIVVYVPQGCKEAYEQSSVWSDFTIVEMGTTDLQSPSMPEVSPVLYDLQGRQATGSPRKGIYIKNGRKSLYR